MAQRLLAARIALALTGLLVPVVCAQSPAWKHADALARLRVSASSVYAHQVRVDLPAALLGKVNGVAAYTHDGTRVAASPITLGGQTTAVWLALGRVVQAAPGPDEPGVQLPIEIYLFGAATIPMPLTEANRRPARLLRSVRPLTTRPFTAPEAVLLLGTLLGGARPPYAFDTPALGDALLRSQGEVASERRSALLLWSTALAVETPLRAALGSDQNQVAWFAFVDGLPVAGWREAQADGQGAWWGPSVALEPGLHTVDFLVIQRHGEPMPACLWKPEGQARQALVGSCPVTHPEAVEVQLAAAGPAVGVRLANLRRFFFQDSGMDVLCCTPLAAEGGALPTEVQVLLDGTPWTAGTPSRSLFVPAPNLPTITLKGPADSPEVRLPARRVAAAPQRLAGHCRLGALPTVVAAAEPLPLTASVTFASFRDPAQELDPRLLRQLEVVARQADNGGQTLREDSLALGRPGTYAGEVALRTETTRVLVEVRLSGLRLLPPATVRVLRASADLAGLEARGDALFQAGERVVLACRPLGLLGGGETARTPPRPWERLALLDDLCATVDAPGARLLPERAIGQHWQPQLIVFRESSGEGIDTGTRPEVARLPALVRLLEMRPEAVMLAVGAADLRAGRPPRDLCRDLLFMAQAVSAAGACPILVALPGLPEVPAEESRRAALLCMELAWRLSVPVMDANSGERLDLLGGQTFAETFAVSEGQLALAGPNDRGRQWLCALMEQTIVAAQKARGL